MNFVLIVLNYNDWETTPYKENKVIALSLEVGKEKE